MVQTVGERGGSGLVHQAQHFQSSDTSRVLGGLPLRIVKVGRYGDDGLGHRRAKVAFSIALQLAQDKCRNLGRSEGLVAQLDAQDFARCEIICQPEREKFQLFLNVLDPAPHQALDAIHRTLRGLDQVLACSAANNNLPILVERDHRRHQI